ncbi:helix-turn-helix domain-containing protein [Saccharothrix lopnurensis]|uniref:Helix-turn-helix domain-containing protein n=1 Tax=Saccharothrix lopnurensis TaxID=1670621 RepID=A0ABW1P5S8_9PSEU
MGESPSPTILRVRLGQQLRDLARSAGHTPQAVAHHLGLNPSTISKIYNGRQVVRVSAVRSLAALCGAEEQLTAELVEVARAASQPGWWAAYSDTVAEWFRQLLGLEQAASVIMIYEIQFIPGLLQTEAYIRATTRRARPDIAAEELERLVAFRMARQQHLHDDGTPRMTIVLDEAVLCRPVGGPAVWRAQLERLVEVAEQPDVTLLVLPFAAGEHPLMGSAAKLLKFDSEPSLDTVYLENDRSGQLLRSSAEVSDYTKRFARLVEQAATADESHKMLVTLATHL